MKRRLKLVALATAEVALDVVRARVRVEIARELLADARERVDAVERVAAEMRAAKVPPSEWN